MEDLEDMMMLEAIRLSLAAEEERKRKEEKEAKKEAKKKEKAEKKAEKAAKKGGMYSAGGSSASGSALSLALPGIGRRRGNSASSTLLREAANNAEKGKSVDRSTTPTPTGESSTAPMPIGKSSSSPAMSSMRQHLDTGIGPPLMGDLPQHVQSGTVPNKPSHLRTMSNTSSPASSFIESLPGSLRNGGFHGSSSSLDSPNADGTHLGSGTPDRDGDPGSAGTEPMFNFRSLAEMMGREEEKENESKHVEYSEKHGRERGESSASPPKIPENGLEQSFMTLKPATGDELRPGNVTNDNVHSTTLESRPKLTAPELMITPVTPAATGSKEEESMQLGAGMKFAMEHGGNATQ